MTVILAHADGDGLCSASLIKMIPKYHNSRVFFSHPVGITHDLPEMDEDLIFTDIAIDEKEYEKIFELFQEYTKKHHILYFDHHRLPGSLPSDVKVVSDENKCSTELVYRYFYNQLPEIASHFACLGAISDYEDETPLIQELILHYERRALFLDAGILSQGLGPIHKDYDYLRGLVEEFGNGKYPSEIKKLVTNAMKVTQQDKKSRRKVLQIYKAGNYIAWVRNPPASKSKAAHWVLADSSKIIGMTILDHHSKKELIDISFRGRNLIDLRDLIPPIAKEFGGSGGGHKNALGCRIPAMNLELFLETTDKKIADMGVKNPRKIKDVIDNSF